MKKILYIILGIFFCLCLPSSIIAADEPPTDQVILYMVDNLSLNDINQENTPYLWHLQEKAGIGLLNTITGGDRTIKNACTTISAGKLAVGSSNANLNFQADTIYKQEKVMDSFYRSTGYQAAPENILVTNIEVIHRNNKQRKLGLPGQLGDSLHNLGLTTAIIGNSDRFDIIDRPGALILMDSKGIVDRGHIENQVNFIDNPFSSYWANYNFLHEQFNSIRDSNVILIEYGDLTRLEAMYSLLSTETYKEKRKTILSQIDGSIQSIDTNLENPNAIRYVFSPSPSRNAYIPNALLTPLIIVKADQTGTLTSYSTRREGIVLLANLKNSILNCFTSSIKDPIYATPHANSHEYLKNLNKRAVFSYTNQKWILTIFVSIIILLLLFTFYLLYKPKYRQLVENILVLILSWPLVLLIISFFPIYNKYLFVSVMICLSALFTIIVLVLNKITKINKLMIILILTIITICLDLVWGLGLIAKSIMSYQIISGARYYGIGNEYMGVLIGATISFAALYLNTLYTHRRLNLIKLIFAIIVFLIAYPLFGINVGGTITACIALGYTLITFYKTRIEIQDIAWLAMGTLLIILIIAWLDMSQPFELQSHLGKNIHLISNQGFHEFINLVTRKLEMHLQIINYKYLGWVFLVLLAGIILFIYKPNQKIKEIETSLNYLYIGLKGIIIAAIIAFVFNDSGLTAAATSSIYFVCLLIYALKINIS